MTIKNKICSKADPIRCYCADCFDPDLGYGLCEEAKPHCCADHSEIPYCFEMDEDVYCEDM